jgi:hypothetical protein
MALVQRYDIGRLSKATRTGAGGARVPASIARTGIQVYQDANGNTVREYRAPDVVFDPAALASLASIPVTIGHPGKVDARTWRRHAVGHVTDAPPTRRADEATPGVEWVDSAIVVQDAAALDRIDREDLVEVSMGYLADVVAEAGVTPTGERYDAVQRGIQFNHLALLPAGKARAGSGARLRLDGNEVALGDEEIHVGDRKIKVDGVEYDFGSESHISALDALLARSAQQLGELKAKFDAQESELAKLKGVDVNALVQDELDFRVAILPALPKGANGEAYSFAGKTRDQVRADAVGAEVMAKVAKLPEAERPGYITFALEQRLAEIAKGAGATRERKPLHVVKRDEDKEKPAPKADPILDAYNKSWTQCGANGSMK